MTHAKKDKLPEFARWRYKLKIDVEETKIRTENRSFSCRHLEGQPKNKKGKNGTCELYPLPEYEITGGSLSPNMKIQIAPKTTQIFYFGQELIKPSQVTFENIEPFIEKIETTANDLENAENIMNELAAFVDKEKERFSQSTRIYLKIPAMYRLIIASKDTTEQLFDIIMKKFWDEYNLAFGELLQGKVFLASKRIDELVNEAVFFQRGLIDTAKKMKDPRAEQWEANLNNLLINPFGFGNYSLRKT